MFETLSKGFRSAQMALRGQTRLTAENLEPALREVRSALLQADVNLEAVKVFLQRVKEQLLGDVVQLKDKSGKVRNLTPQDHFVKACYDELVELLGPAEPALELRGDPAVILMVGLQGSGKTTTTGKLAKRLIEQGRKPLLVAADVYRPAAIEQLMVLGRRLNVPVFSIKGMSPVDLAKSGVAQAKAVGKDVVIVDTAGRLAIDETLMKEVEDIQTAVRPGEVLFVADAMIGQDAVATAAEFHRRLDFTGFVLTKMEGDARGGAALSIKHVTGKPVKFIGTGEDLDRLEAFRPEGLAQRILGMGDVVGLVQDFEKHADLATAEKSAERMFQGRFSYDDFVDQMKTIRRMGPLREIMAKIPMLGGMLDQIPEEALDDGELDRTMAIIGSMTTQERKDPDVMNASRIRRIAKGSGRTVADVEALHDRFLQARKMIGAMFGGAGGPLGGLANMQKMMAGGGMPPGMGGMMGALGGGEPAKVRPVITVDERRAKKQKRKEREKAKKKNR